MKKQHNYTVMHWGTWQVQARDGHIAAVTPVPWDKSPSRIGQSLPDAVTGNARVQAEKDRISTALGEDGRILLRESGTEPVIRVMVEGDQQQEVETLAQHLADAVRAYAQAA